MSSVDNHCIEVKARGQTSSRVELYPFEQPRRRRGRPHGVIPQTGSILYDWGNGPVYEKTVSGDLANAAS